MLTSKKSKTLVALGSNISDDLDKSLNVVEQSIEIISVNSMKLLNKSQFYQTPAFPIGSGPDFINCVLSVETDLSPDELLIVFHEIEATLGRKRGKRWEQRVIDIDLLCYEDLVKPNKSIVTEWIDMALSEQIKRTPEHLILPHPRIQDRAFVLVPMADVAPNWRHPVIGQTTLEMRDALPNELANEIRKYQPNN
jgi:2-amino-4-hydroxy-6-hydroxymethyldihydropteridine diphosphokinase